MTQTVTHYGMKINQDGVAYGRMTKAEILHDVPSAIYRNARRTAHNEYERRQVTDWRVEATIVRYRLTDIVTVWLGLETHYLKLDFGGWHTISTRRHMMDAARRHGWSIGVSTDGARGSAVVVYETPAGSVSRSPVPWRVIVWDTPVTLKAQGAGLTVLR